MIYQLGVLFLLGMMSVTSALPPCVCGRNLHPVCGSDGNTYSNECRLQCAQLSNPELVMEKTGRCDGTNLGPANSICTLEYNPVCGTDGQTYSNPCSLRYAQRSAPVEMAHMGECRVKRELNLDSEHCICTFEYKPVCGTDGQTYGNACALRCAQRSAPVEMAHMGQCRAKRESCSCPRLRKPVCGSDGQTYANPCMLDCAKQTQVGLEMTSFGECGDSVKVVDQPSCICTRQMKLVCGTDGNTYNNPCLLNCAREQDENLHIDHVGPCDNEVKVVEDAENTSCACTRNLKPVCASNGVTFNNECLMRCAGTHLTVAHQGFCEE